MKIIKKVSSLLLLFVVLAGILSGCGSDTNKSHISSLADLESATIGIITGTNYDNVAKEKFPNAGRKYFSTSADVLIALEQGKVDAFFADKVVLASMQWENRKVNYIDEPVDTISNALILKKQGYDEKLLAQLNEFIGNSKNNGMLDRLEEKWLGDAEPTEHPDYTKLSGENGTLKIAVSDSLKPVSYQKGSMYTGYEVDFITLFAKEYGYKLELQGMAFDALIPSVESGKCDIGASAITITPERAESVTFTDPHFETYGVALICDDSSAYSSKVTLTDFKNATLGILTGSSHDKTVKELFPNAKRVYFSNVSDMILAVEQEKIDGYLEDAPFLAPLIWEGVNLKRIDESVGQMSNGFVFPRGRSTTLRRQINEFLKTAKSDGTIERLAKKWFGETEPTEHPDYSALTGENGIIRLAISVDNKPILYQNANGFTGFEMELLTLFAQHFGYVYDIEVVPFESIIAGISSSKYDMGASSLNITPEREESVDFSDAYSSFDVIITTKSNAVVYNNGEQFAAFFGDLKESFEKTFIREERWKMIAEGIGVTMLISILAILVGSLLGFALYMLSCSESKILRETIKGISKVYSKIIAGTPVVVILMILFYVVFGKMKDMSGIVVAIIGFSMVFGAFVYEHMRVAVGSVDNGQIEAAYALGYNKNKTFFRIVFPQAMKIFLPSYCGQIVDLIKATAVVGYIAVNDLTKMGDIIRSNTYEAFFPLIATAVIYFILTWIVASLLNIIKFKFEPERRNEKAILKGVEK